MSTNIASVSRTALSQRRQQLRKRRRVRLLQSIWRVLAVSGLAGGAVWVAQLPIWVIQRPEQVVIQGNQFIPTQTLRSLLPISYPQSLFWIEPQAIVQRLQARAPLASVVVSRQLFPPGLTVQVKERYPVAIALSTAADAQVLASPVGANAAGTPASTAKAGLLDESGIWIPLENYTTLDQSLKLPTLKIIGNLEQYRPYWAKLYQAVRRSPVTISEIDWQDPTNLRLKTELGNVHLGSYGEQFAEQLKTLDRLRKIRHDANFNQIDYIDLRIPEAPSLRMAKPKDPVKSGTP